MFSYVLKTKKQFSLEVNIKEAVKKKITEFSGKAPNTCPLTIQKTNQALVIGIGEKEAQPGSLTVAVGKIADYIESVGY